VKRRLSGTGGGSVPKRSFQWIRGGRAVSLAGWHFMGGTASVPSHFFPRFPDRIEDKSDGPEFESKNRSFPVEKLP
jgi:hypothetical protein